MITKSWILILITALFVSGCGVIHRVSPEPELRVDLPKRFSQLDTRDTQTQSSTVAFAAQSSRQWWLTFPHPQLHNAIQSAFARNLNLKQAFARLQAAKAAAGVAKSLYLPSANISADISKSDGVQNFVGRNVRVDQSSLTLSAGATYEVDLWGRVKATAKAGESDFAATTYDLDAAILSLAAELTEVWFQIAEQQATLALLTAQAKANRTYLELVELRYGQGLTTGLAVFQQKQQTAALESQIPPVKSALATQKHRLNILLGQVPGTETYEVGSLIELPELPEVGIPTSILQQRPDVLAARSRVLAADHRVGAAIASRFPQINMSVSSGFRGFDLAKGLFENWFVNLASGLTMPLFDQYRLSKEQKRAEALLQEQISRYGQTVLVALGEVEDALIQEKMQKELLHELKEQLDAAENTLSEARRRYLNGLSDYLPVLTALQSLHGVQRQVLLAERQQISIRIRLHRALGGTWMNQIREEDKDE